MKLKKIFVIHLMAMSMVGLSLAQNLRSEYDSSRVHIQRNDFAGAISWLEKAKLSASANLGDTNTYVEVIKLLAVCHARLNHPDLAEKFFKETTDLYAKMPSKQNQYASSMQNFGIFYYNQKKYKEAEPIFKKAEAVKKTVAGEKNQEYISILNSLASTQNNLRNFVEAEKSFKKLIELRKEVTGTSHPDYLVALNTLATLYKITARSKEMLDVYGEIVVLTKQSKGEVSKEYAQALTNLANACKTLMLYDKAEVNYLEANKIYLNLYGQKHIDYGVSLVNLAGVYRVEGKFEQAEPLYYRALELFLEITGESSTEYASVLNNVALFYSEIGKYEQAETYFKHALEVSKKVLGEKHPETATTINNLGLLYKSIGRYEQAEPLLKKAQRIRKETVGENHADYAASLNNLAGLYEVMGRAEQAEPLYKQSLTILKQGNSEKTPEYASTLNNLAGVYEQLKKYSSAEPLYTQALAIIKEILGENHSDYATTLNNLALLYDGMGKRDEALAMYKQNLETTKLALGEKHPNYATSLNNYALLLENTGKYKEAEPYFLQAMNVRKEGLGEHHPAYANTLYELAKLYSCMKNYQLADQYWDKALGSYLYQIDTYFPAMSEKEKGKFYNIISPKFEQFNSYALVRYRDNPAILSKMYNNQLATKALLLNATNKVRQRILSSNDQALIAKYHQWNNQKEILSKAYAMSVQELKAQNINLDDLNNTTNELEKELSASSEVFRNVNDNQAAAWQDVQKKLKPEEAAVEVIRFTKFRFDSAGVYQPDSVFYVALIISQASKNNPEIAIIKNGTELERKMIKYYRNMIMSKSEDDLSYSQYWSRIKAKLGNAKSIFLSPDGVYNQLSLNTLRSSQTKTFLLDEIDIKIVTNTKDLLSAKAGENPDRTITLIGSPDFAYNARNISKEVAGVSAEQAQFVERASASALAPLPGTKVEIEKIAGMMSTNNWKTEIYTEHNALEENIKRQNSPKVLHIATHGFFEQDAQNSRKKKKEDEDQELENPLLKSGLFLAGSSLTLIKRKNDQVNIDIAIKGKEDGVLTAYEAMNLNLDKTDLVILSACETGLGEVKNGEGVYGLQRAFNVAGAKAIIISLWTVNDAATQKLMTAFYQEWIKNGNMRQSFRNAQYALKKDFPDPYFWGAFVMIGG